MSFGFYKYNGDKCGVCLSISRQRKSMNGIATIIYRVVLRLLCATDMMAKTFQLNITRTLCYVGIMPTVIDEETEPQ